MRAVLLAAVMALVSATESENAVKNGDFSVWTGYNGHGFTTTSVAASKPGDMPDGWGGGPGAGATATYDVVDFEPSQTEVPGSPKRFLRIVWQTPPSKDWPGETHHQPAFRCTFLEHYAINDVKRFAGKTARFSFYARVAEGELDVVPIMWHSYDASTPGIVGVKGKGYELFESSGKPGEVAVAQGKPRLEAACHLTTKWQRFEKLIALPSTEGKSITPGHYTGVGFDMISRDIRSVDITNVEVVEDRPNP